MRRREQRARGWAAFAACLSMSALLAEEAPSVAGDGELDARGGLSGAVSSPHRAAPSDGVSPPPAPSLAATSPLEIPELDALMSKALRAGRTPGAVVLVGRKSGVVFRRAYGRRAIVPEREEMTVDTIFDLASLTKPLVVGTLVQWLIEQGRLDIREPAVEYLPEFGVREKYLVTVEQLLLHTSGLPPINTLRDYWQGAERARRLALGGWLYKYPGREFIYSDLGYIALGELIENVTGERLDQTAERVLWQPLGMRDTRYCPTLCDDPRIAPTESNRGWTKNPIRGEPSDPRVHRLGGVAGNAGLFSSADDLARYARMVLGEGELDGVRVLAAERVRDMLRPRPVPGATRALGWDVASGFASGRGHSLSARAVGHGGYTGTSLWIDPEQDLFVVFLSNRNHPYGTGRVTDLYGPITDAAVRALRAEGPPSASLGAGSGGGDRVAPPTAPPVVEPRGCSGGDAACSSRRSLHRADG